MSKTDHNLSIIAQDMHSVDKIIGQRLTTSVPLIGQVAQYTISAGGKRLRPSLLLLMARSLNYKGMQHLEMAAVIEFIHTATLLHDDVVDESDMRRGRPSANNSFGNPASVLVGDFLHSRAFEMMVETGNLRVMQVIANATNIIAEGEVQQLLNMHDSNLSFDGYLQVIRSKTAKLFEASTQVAAILAGAAEPTEQAAAQYGNTLGTAFQIIDDLLDYDGDTSEMGKSVGDDLREGKITLPLMIAIQRGTDAQKKIIRNSIEEGNTSQLAQIIEIVRATGALDATREAAHAQAQQAIDLLEGFPNNNYTKALRALPERLLLRRN